MNPDCWLHVLSFLDLKSKVRCERVSRSFRKLALVSLTRQQSLQSVQEWDAKSGHESMDDEVPASLFQNMEQKCSDLQTLLSKCPNLMHIAIRCSSPDPPDRLIRLISSSCPKVRSLHLTCPNVRIGWAGSVFESETESAFTVMMQGLPFLSSLSLPFCSTGRLQQLLHQKRMQRLNFSVFNEPVTSVHLADATRDLVQFSGPLILTRDAIRQLSHSCPGLKILSSGPLDNEDLSFLVQRLTRLQDLSFGLSRSFVVDRMESLTGLSELQGLQITTTVFTHFDGAVHTMLRDTGRRVTRLELEGFLLTDLSLSFLPLLSPGLRDLTIRRSVFLPAVLVPGITDDSFKSFARLPAIRSIDLDTGNSVSEAGIAFFFTHCVSPDLRFVRVWDATKPLVSPAVLSAAADFTRSRVPEKRILTLMLDHPLVHGLEADQPLNNSLSQDQVSRRFDASADGVRMNLSVFSQSRPKNLHVTVRLGSQSIVLK